MKTPKVIRQSWSAEIQREWSAGYAPSVQVRLPGYFLSFPPAMPFAEQEAAAHVIATAPDALDALRALIPYAESRVEDLEILRDSMSECDGTRISADGRARGNENARKARAALDEARALIAKAEGRL